MTNQLITLTLIWCFFLTSCKTENDMEAMEPRQAEKFIFYGNQEKYRNAISARVNDPGNPFTIKKVQALKNTSPHGHDILEITVSHYRGCSQDFEMIWDGTIMESFPEQVNMFLHLKGACQDDQELVETVLLLDIDEFIGRADLVDRATFHILNGSEASSENDQSVSTWHDHSIQGQN